mgnify:CR=1 FL=1
MSKSFIFSSESVGEGHPDKVSDSISDSILDACLEQDPQSRVACETLVKSNCVTIAGEITTDAKFDYEKVVREAIRKIGYINDDDIFHADQVFITNQLTAQSRDIGQGVDAAAAEGKDTAEQGAGDQGIMFGFASNETDVLMPAPITYAHLLMRKQAELRKNGQLKFLRPDAKSQVTFRYDQDGVAQGIEAVVLSTQHDPDISLKDLQEAVMEEIIKPVLPANWLSKDTKYFINPTGNFVIGGPVGDCGLTGRKIIVDTYGGMARHGGGAFSGKDPSKVDRSAAYAGRYVAKNLVAAGIADRCEIQISYAIGVAEPTSISVNTFGTNNISDEKIEALVRKYFDLRPKGLIEMLDLKRPIFQPTASYGHFGRTEDSFTWERTDRAEALASEV